MAYVRVLFGIYNGPAKVLGVKKNVIAISYEMMGINTCNHTDIVPYDRQIPPTQAEDKPEGEGICQTWGGERDTPGEVKRRLS